MGDRHTASRLLASECASLGARSHTIAVVTGIPRSEALQLLSDHGARLRPGKHPESSEFVHRCNLMTRIEVSNFLARVGRMLYLGVSPPEALLSAYRLYLALHSGAGKPAGGQRVSLDRAFDLACHTFGLWTCVKPDLLLRACPDCRNCYVAAPFRESLLSILSSGRLILLS